MTLPLNSRLSALYDTNGTQKDFSFGFRVFFDPDNGGYGLEVRRQTADGYEVIPKSDYLVLPVEDNSAGVVRFSVAPSAGQQIYIAGKTPTIQQLVLTNFGRYSAESIETQFDFITAIIQEWLSALGEETRQRIAADDILTQYVVNRIDDFVQQINQNWDDKSQEIEDYISTIMPSFTQALREEIEAYAVAGMQDAIDQTLADSRAEIDEVISLANAAATAVAITGKVYDTPGAGVDPVTGVQNGAYYNVRSPDDDSYVDEYQNVGGVATATGKSYPSSSYVDGTVYSVGSVAEMISLSIGFRRRVVQVKATGAMYQYDSSRAGVDDGVYIRSGWVLIGYHDQLLAGTAGLKGDSTNEYTKLKALLDVAAVLKRPVNMCGLNIETSSLTLAGDIKLVGTGGIKLVSGSLNPTLLNTAYNLVVDGEITLDQNMAGNAGGVISSETHCTIKHNGDILGLRGAKFKPSRSINIVSRANKKAIFKDIEVDGGMIGIFAPTPNAKVEVIGGIYKNSTLYDNIQILNGGDVTIERVTSLNSARSGIIVNNASKRVRMISNFATGAKVDGSNQGGWGIVCSQNTQDSVVMGNICLNNQRGGATIDTYPDSGASVDNRVVVSGNILGGKFNDAYATSGLVLNNAKHSNVTGNIIFSVNQGILAVDADLSTVHGNTVIDTTEFFFNAVTSLGIQLKNNIFDGCSVGGTNAAIRFIDSSKFRSSGNTLKNLSGTGVVYRVSGITKDWLISDEKVEKTVASSGWLFNILGANNTGGKIRNCDIKADGVAGWQWYIYSDNLAQFSTHGNEIESSGISYIYQGANVTAGDDTVNGSRNYWSSIPTAFKSRIGQIATIANIQKAWTGTAWVSANVVAVTYDPPSIAAGASATTTVAVTGAVFGDFAQASFSSYNQDIEISAVVSGTNQVTVKFRNIGAAPIDLSSGTLRVKVS